ncbi:MAG: hypothetical protein GDA48_18470 [Hormoscilla sp. GM102CHS1]|nr:hypothetical protein [Hormoscilla sp. GM102CHS1]
MTFGSNIPRSIGSLYNITWDFLCKIDRYSGREDILVGTRISGGTRA